MKTLIISELYKSIQGESQYAGLPCAFVRLTGCPLRCRWCDTTYGFKGGRKLTFSQIIEEVEALEVPLIEFTGGEPLAQSESTELMAEFLSLGKTVLLETSGSIFLESVPKGVHIIMDVKCPSSGMSHKNDLNNFSFLKKTDEVKLVIADERDYEWAKEFVYEHQLTERFQVLFSPVWKEMDPKDLVSWFLRDKLSVRLNLQLHKYIWPNIEKGV
jgi:7-carboxy-7-deazaguanine synthase